jgi:hypothetical protein
VEDTDVANQTVAVLAQCIASAGGNKAKIKRCEDDFVAGGGTVTAQQGGKVFTDTTGGKVFVSDAGKVFDNPP